MRVIIVGGGISGVFAAIELRKNNHDVIILEKNDRILKKMLVTGNGRCNLTNIELTDKNYHSENNFVKNSIKRFDNNDFISYLNSVGLVTTQESNGKIYPISLKASSVVNILLEELIDLGVEIFTNTKVVAIKKNKGFVVNTQAESFKCDKLIFAVGGASMASTGSDGKSYEILNKLGHTIKPIFPGLTQVKLDSNYLKHLSGVKVVGLAKLYNDDTVIDSKYGEILFTNYGLSGPPILDLSRTVNLYKSNLMIKLPLINNIKDMKKLEDDLYNRIYLLESYSIERWLLGLVDKKFIYVILDILNLDKDAPINTLSIKQIKLLIRALTNMNFIVVGTKGFETSQVTCGGVDTNEIGDMSFESKIINGLYIVGEVMDVDGDCGGYNIQWAATSGILAARAIKS